MINVTSLMVRSFDLDSLTLLWEIPVVDEIIDDYDFFVLRSIDGAAGPWETIAGPFVNTYIFRDAGVNLLHKWREYFYRIKVVNRTTGDEQVSTPENLQAPPDLIGSEIRRRETLLFKEFAGRQVVLFPQLTFGQRCPTCWDIGPRGNTIGRSTMQNCVTCYDTTFVGGFSTPMLIWVQIDPATKETQPSDIGDQTYVETSARATWFPPIKPKDMIVEVENKRWSVKRTSTTEKLRAAIRQELTLRQYPRDDVRYKIPVKLELARQMGPAREFKRQMDIQEPVDAQGKIVVP